MSRCTLHLCSAVGDGIGPAALLTLGENGPQYLFNAPEGYARLVLEHKTRPSAKLQALFALQPQALGGLGALLMRLREDGHGEMHVVGPQGTVTQVHSLRHFMRWKHPSLYIRELIPSAPEPVFEDGHVTVIALHASCAGWQAPEWLMKLGSRSSGQTDAAKTEQGNLENTWHKQFSSSSEEESTGDEGSSSAASESSSDEDVAELERMEIADGAVEANGANKTHPAVAAGMQENAFREIDKMLQGDWQKESIFQVLQKQQQQQPQQEPKKRKRKTPLPPIKATHAPLARQPCPASKNEKGTGTQGDFTALEEGGNPVYVQQQKQGRTGNAQHPCALMCHLKASDRALLVVDCPEPAQRRLLSGHPAMKQLQASSRFVNILHLSAAASVRTSAYGDWAKHLPGQQVFASEANIGDGPELGHIGSARNLAKLHVVSPAVFPLPAAMTGPSGEDIYIPEDPEEPDSAARAENGVQEIAVALDTDKLLQIRVQGTINAGEVQKELLSRRPALQRLLQELQGSPLSKPFTCQLSQPCPPSQPASDLSFLGPATVPFFCPQAAVFVPLAVDGFEGGFPGACPPQIPPHPPPGHRLPPQGPTRPPFRRHAPPPQVLPGPRPPRGFAPVLGARRPQLRPWQPPTHGPHPPAIACAGRAGFGGPIFSHSGSGGKIHPRPDGGDGGRPAKRRMSGEHDGAADTKDMQMGRCKVEGEQPSNRGAAVALRLKMHGGNAPPESQDGPPVSTGMDSNPAISNGGPAVKQPGNDEDVPVFLETLELAATKESNDVQQPCSAAASDNGQALVGVVGQTLENASKGQDRTPGKPSGSAGVLDTVMEEARKGSGVQPDMLKAEQKTETPKQAEVMDMAVGPNRAQEAAKAAARNVPKLIVACPARNPATPECLKAMAARGDGSQVLFLGTGCAEPSKYRGGASVHVRLADGRGLLLDAGEGTLGQLVRHFGPAGAAKQVDALCAVWISHKHADHMLGLLGILKARSANTPPLLVIGPMPAQRWLAEAGQALQPRYHFVHCKDFDASGGPSRLWLMSMTGMVSWQSVPVEHCADAYGLVIRHVSGWSLVYSGDSRPCRRLQEAGRGCTLLIHEATFEPALHSQARQKRHSTTEEALRVAARMGAYRVILTHFSSRYPKMPIGLPTTGPLSEMVATACDGMRVPLVLLPELPKLMPAVTAALADGEAANGSTVLRR